MSALVLRASMIFTADRTGTCQCEIMAVSTDSQQAIARAGTPLTRGTFPDAGNFTADPAGEREGPFCPANDSQPPPWPARPYFGGGQFAPASSRVLSDDGPTWTAGPDATSADAAGQPEVTSCFYRTRSCRPGYHGGSWSGHPADHDAVSRTPMELIQQDPAGGPCAVTRRAELTPDAASDIHHLLVNPGHVISQEPAAGTQARPGATTRITADTANPRTCIIN